MFRASFHQVQSCWSPQRSSVVSPFGKKRRASGFNSSGTRSSSERGPGDEGGGGICAGAGAGLGFSVCAGGGEPNEFIGANGTGPTGGHGGVALPVPPGSALDPPKLASGGTNGLVAAGTWPKGKPRTPPRAICSPGVRKGSSPKAGAEGPPARASRINSNTSSGAAGFGAGAVPATGPHSWFAIPLLAGSSMTGRLPPKKRPPTSGYATGCARPNGGAARYPEAMIA